MKLDNEEQRRLLLEMINATPIHGTVGTITEGLVPIRNLKVAIAEAKIEKDEKE